MLPWQGLVLQLSWALGSKKHNLIELLFCTGMFWAGNDINSKGV